MKNIIKFLKSKFIFSINIVLLSLCFCNKTQAQIEPYPDNSVEVNRFEEMGVPSIDTIWTAKEYKKVVETLGKIKGLDKYSLPRKNSPHSGALFDHMVATKHVDFIIDKNYDLRSRLDAVETLAYMPVQLINLYYENKKEGERFGKEVLPLMLLWGQTARNTMMIINELKLILPEEKQKGDFEKSYNSLQKELDDLTLRLFNVLEQESENYNEKDLENFAKKLVDFYPSTHPLNSKIIQDRNKHSIKSISKNYSSKKVRKLMKQLLKKLKK